MTLLAVRDLEVRFGDAAVVAGVSFDVAPGECLAIVGESGSGKTQACLAPFGLSAGRAAGSVRLDGRELIGASETALRQVRERRVGFVLQQPLTALTPHLTIGAQLAESAGRRLGMAERVRMLDEVRLTDPSRRLRQYPHELSAGMRQRAMIAMALAANPKLLIADEPTTALDVIVQREIFDLLDRLRHDRAMGLILVGNDLGLVANRADRVMVMRRGRAVEWGPAARVLARPRAVYTQALVAASPRLDTPLDPRPSIGAPLLEAKGVTVDFRVSDGLFRRVTQRAVDKVSLVVRDGEALGIVGGSGSGKSALARAVARVGPMDAGELRWRGMPLPARGRLTPAERRGFRVVFQDPVDSLDPRLRVGDAIAAPLAKLRPDIPRERHARLVVDAMREVGLDPALWDRRPSQLSGGQNQRISIARALISEPALLICDVSAQAQLVELLQRLQRKRGLALLLVSHDIALVRQLCHRIMVLDRGRVVEEGPTEGVIGIPRTDYMRKLIAAAR
jgi:microcin C transport system ATP-binding protein